MNSDRLHPELKQQTLKTPNLPLVSLKGIKLKRFLFRYLSRPKGLKKSGNKNAFKVVQIGSQQLHIYQPPNPSGTAVLWIHGGGHLIGTPEQLKMMAITMATALNAVVALPSYRLAPEDPFPADLDDCYRAWKWLEASAPDYNIDPNKMVLAGNSAGGGIAAGLTLRLLDEGAKLPAAQILYYPMLDDRTAINSELDKENHFIWNNPINRSAWSAYLGTHQINAESLPEYVSPARRENLAGLPPTWIGVGELDLFYEENLAYKKRLEEVGVEVALTIGEGAPHAFDMLVPHATVSKQFNQEAFDFIQATVNKT